MHLSQANLLALLANYLQIYPNNKHALETLEFVSQHQNFWQRSTLHGHVTASAWVVNTSFTEVVLVHHLALNKWFQPGGHIEPHDQSLFDAAAREAREETGLINLTQPSLSIFDVDVHTIPLSAKGVAPHKHYDIRILLIANSTEALAVDPNEAYNVKWVPLNSIEHYTKEESVLRMVQKTK